MTGLFQKGRFEKNSCLRTKSARLRKLNGICLKFHSTLVKFVFQEMVKNSQNRFLIIFKTIFHCDIYYFFRNESNMSQ